MRSISYIYYDGVPSPNGTMKKSLFLLALLSFHFCQAQLKPTLVKDITPGAAGTEFMRSTVFDGKIVFTTRIRVGSSNYSQLWISDGTGPGTVPLGTFDDNWSPTGLVVMGNKLFFTAADTVYGNELRYTDGTAAGTNVVRDIRPGKIYGLGSPPVVLYNKLYFIAHGGTYVAEIWESDGTEAGTKLFAYIDPPGGGGCNLGSPMVVNNRLFFNASYGAGRVELWTSDTTAFGATTSVSIEGDEIANRVAVGDKMYFIVRATDTAGNTTHSFYVSDGTAAGTQLLINDMVRILDYAEMGGRLYIYGITPSVSGIWSTDGTVAGTTLVRDSIGGDRCDTYQPGGISLTVFKDKLYFGCGGTERNGNELWVSDGTRAGTHSIMSFSAPRLDGGGIHPRQLTATNDYLYFKAWDDSTNTVNLWQTDGTAKHTRKISKRGAHKTYTTQICAPVSSLVELVDSTIFYVIEYDSINTGNELYKVAAYSSSDVDTNSNPLDSATAFFRFYPNPTNGDLFINVNFD